MVRSYPNIVITGTPGTGKSTHATLLATEYTTPHGVAPLRNLDVSSLVKARHLYTSYSREWDSYEVDEDRLLDELEPLTGGTAPEPDGAELDPPEPDGSDARGGLILDWHTCDLYPERWVDLVVVLRCDHSLLWTRLESRNYSLAKIQENNTAEIMSVVLEDARASYPAEAVVELQSHSSDDVERNVERIVQWIREWRRQRGFHDDDDDAQKDAQDE